MYLSHQQRKSTELVIEPPYDVDYQTKNKLYLALILMMIILFGIYSIEQYIASSQFDPIYEPSHNIILWTKSENYTYLVDIAFYGSKQDEIVEQNRLAQASISVRPDMSERIDSVLYALPYTQSVFWIRVGFGYEVAEDEWQWEYTSDILKLGVELCVHIEGHEFVILVTPVQ